jgi:small neutral amino acid transporter SnatA (MarC family)
MYKESVIIGFMFLAIGIPFVTHAIYDYSIKFEIRNEFLSIFEIGIPLTIMSAGVTLTLAGFAMKKPERQAEEF